MQNRVRGTLAAVAAVAGVVVGHSVVAGPALEADRAFAALSRAKGAPAAFDAFAAETVRLFQPGGPLKGRAAMNESFRDFPAGATLDWVPEEEQLGTAGDHGFTWGRWVRRVPAETGRPAGCATGTYLTVWARQPDGEWKFTADIGQPDTKADPVQCPPAE